MKRLLLAIVVSAPAIVVGVPLHYALNVGVFIRRWREQRYDQRRRKVRSV